MGHIWVTEDVIRKTLVFQHCVSYSWSRFTYDFWCIYSKSQKDSFFPKIGQTAIRNKKIHYDVRAKTYNDRNRNHSRSTALERLVKY